MSVDSGILIEAVVSHAAASGYFQIVNTHEPKSAPIVPNLSAAVWVQSLGPWAPQSGLAATSARLVVNLRIFTDTLQEPQDMIDPNMMQAVDALMTAYSSDFTLDGLISNIDLLSQGGESLGGQAGYIDIDRKKFRVYTITIPMIINDAWTQAP